MTFFQYQRSPNIMLGLLVIFSRLCNNIVGATVLQGG